jgi:hypothetical protein
MRARSRGRGRECVVGVIVRSGIPATGDVGRRTMGSMPGYNVSKGPFAFLDAMFDGTNPQAYKDAKTMLAGSLKAAADARFTPGNTRVKHFDDHWLSNGNHWKHLQPEETLKAGLTSAIVKAQGIDPDHPKPMEFFWVCANENEFNVYFCDGPRQVTVIILTPPPLDTGGHASGATVSLTRLTEPEPIWVVKARDTWETATPGNGYPGPITTLKTVPPPNPATIIRRQIYSD